MPKIQLFRIPILPVGRKRQPFELGVCIFSPDTDAQLYSYLNDLAAAKITRLRFDITNYQSPDNDAWNAGVKATIIKAVARGFKVSWGTSSRSLENTDYVITQANWPTFHAAILAAATWAQANGVSEFYIGNEEEGHTQRHPLTLVADAAHKVTATFTENHGFTADNPVQIQWSADSRFDGTYTIGDVAAKSFTYQTTAAPAGDGWTAWCDISDISLDAMIGLVKGVATEVQAIFTRGPVCYSTMAAAQWGAGNTLMSHWRTLGRGDVDILCWNTYLNQTNPTYEEWHTQLANIMSWWGPDHSYITEFDLDSTNLTNYSADEAVQAAGVASMIQAVKAVGIKRAHFFCYNHANFGARTLVSGGVYRQLWNVLKAQNR